MSEHRRKVTPHSEGDARDGASPRYRSGRPAASNAHSSAQGRQPRSRSGASSASAYAAHSRPDVGGAAPRSRSDARRARHDASAHPRPSTRGTSTRSVHRVTGGTYARSNDVRPRTSSTAQRSTRGRAGEVVHAGVTRMHAARDAQMRGTAGRSRTTNKPFTTREPPSARARKMRHEREVARRRQQMRLALGATIAVVCLVLVGFAVRGVVGFIGGLFSGGSKTAETQAGETQQTEQPVVAGKDVTINLAMIGDILQHSGVYQSGFLADGTRNYDHIFAHIGSEIEGADIKVLNQETLLGGTAFEFSGYPSFNGPQEMGDAEVKAGFNVILRATNHALDMGYDGLASELSFWRTTYPTMAVLGAVDPNGTDGASVDDVYVYEKDGFKVALLNYTYDLNGYEDPKGVVSMLTEEHVRTTVQKAEELADMVVVFPHWGEEYMLEPVESQRSMAQVFMDAGADVIIGGHPHVVEPVEVLTASDGRKVPCFWSVGNFVSTQIDNENLIGGVAKVTLTKKADGTCQVDACSFVPTVTHKGTSTDMTTYLLRDWNDDLASTNYLASNGTDNTNLTVAWANEFCTQVFGPGFDTATEQIAFGPESFVAQAPTAGGTAATSTDTTTGAAGETTTSETSDEAEDMPEAA